MNSIPIKSLPVKHVIRDIAEALNTDYEDNCGEYTVNLPSEIGEGFITGIDTEGGVGFLLYDCSFKEETQIKFSINDVHPLKFLYLLSGTIEHYFENNPENVHEIEKYQTAIVASRLDHGHILLFRANTHTSLHSLEIDRRRFTQKMGCDLENLEEDLRSLFKDIEAKDHFYYKDHFSLELADLFEKMYDFKDVDFLRKIYMQGLAYQIFIKQILMYKDYQKDENKRNLLRVHEVAQVKTAADYIETHIRDTPTVEDIGKEVGLNTNKLQQGFKLLYRNTVNKHILDTRLRTARDLLLHTDYTVSEIADQVGINSKSYFSKIFREQYEITPREFREKNKMRDKEEQ
jgi:AraC-like DNA-binding protein